MEANRRVFLALSGKLALIVAALGPRRTAWGQPVWQVRGTRSQDPTAVAAIFNAHLKAGICPYSDLVDPWTSEAAASYLRVFSGTQIVERDGVPVAFGALIDFTDPATTSRLAADVEPEVGVVAFDVEQLTSAEMVEAAKRLAAAMARELRRQGFSGCRMRMPAGPVLASDEWYTRHRTVLRNRTRDSVDYALEVRFDLAGGLAALTAEGY